MNNQIEARPKKMTVECMLCHEIIYLGSNHKVGSFINCSNCDSMFEIINLNPAMIDWPYYDDDENIYDFDDDDYDY